MTPVSSRVEVADSVGAKEGSGDNPDSRERQWRRRRPWQQRQRIYLSGINCGKVTVTIPKDALRVNFSFLFRRIAEKVGMAEELDWVVSLFLDLIRCRRSKLCAEKHHPSKEERRHSGDFSPALERVQCQRRLRGVWHFLGPEPQQDSCHLRPTLKFLLLSFLILLTIPLTIF